MISLKKILSSGLFLNTFLQNGRARNWSRLEQWNWGQNDLKFVAVLIVQNMGLCVWVFVVAFRLKKKKANKRLIE